MAEIIDGKAVSAHVRKQVADGVKELSESKGIIPGLAAVLVGVWANAGSGIPIIPIRAIKPIGNTASLVSKLPSL